MPIFSSEAFVGADSCQRHCLFLIDRAYTQKRGAEIQHPFFVVSSHQFHLDRCGSPDGRLQFS